ncbi:PGN_0703 family putative restriction endonuclease [Methylobacterium iners]|uniref:PD-(D/E)XK nuclease-like domain-containing protein n=1 Tax=Methylobacterium iners TaxID=418707 RepID=A0ABQ4RSK3_9HYPH|nr:hypothetical protein [Methylobacterium iners]GJD93133.1 hypothetical protein OCOJLMKI_0323 [Methylobacterium iners]
MSHPPSSSIAKSESAFTQPLIHAPFLDEATRRRHHTFVATDDRHAASCRMLAHLWRQDQQLPAATFVSRDSANKPRRRPANWLLRQEAAHAGATFLAPTIRDHARQTLLFREPGALWNEERLWGHLLSSQAMTVNLLAGMAIDLTLATQVWRSLLPDFVHEVRGIRLEHSPGRFDDAWFGDGTAVDALIEAVTPEGEAAVITIEVKLVEGLTGPSATPRERYVEAAQASGLYKDASSLTLARAGFEQLHREHVLTDLMLRHGLASRGQFVLIAPKLNRRAQAVAALYRTELVDPAGTNSPATVGFVNITLEAVIAAIAQAGATDLAQRLWTRYCDHARVARFVLYGDERPLAGTMPALSAPASHESADISPAAFMAPETKTSGSPRRRRAS